MSDLDAGEGWVANAMRRNTPMTATTAERLFLLVQKPDPSLVGRKKPQGPSLRVTQDEIDRHTSDPVGYPLQETPTLEYINLIFMAARIIERYSRSLPGSVFVVLPSNARGIAESLANEISDEGVVGKISRSRRNKLVNFLTFYFEIAERPLRFDDSAEIRASLENLGIVHSMVTGRLVNEAYPDEAALDSGAVANALEMAEQRREEVLTEAQNPGPRKKRAVTMPRIRKLLQ